MDPFLKKGGTAAGMPHDKNRVFDFHIFELWIKDRIHPHEKPGKYDVYRTGNYPEEPEIVFTIFPEKVQHCAEPTEGSGPHLFGLVIILIHNQS
jgi:hypothetical protein